MNRTPLLVAAIFIKGALLRVLGQEIPPSTIIAGYFPDYRSYIDLNENISQLLTDVMLFSIAPTMDGVVDGKETCCLDGTHYANARKAKTFNRGMSKDAMDHSLYR